MCSTNCIVVATPKHLVVLELAGCRLKKLHHKLFRTRLLSVTVDDLVICVRDEVNGAMLFRHSREYGLQLIGTCLLPHPLNTAAPFQFIPGDPYYFDHKASAPVCRHFHRVQCL